jgi:hypothetical protein
MYNLIVAESMGDFIDYVDVYNLDILSSVYIFKDTVFEKIIGIKSDNFTIHVTCHACKLPSKKILFMDLQLFLLKANKKISLLFEKD